MMMVHLLIQPLEALEVFNKRIQIWADLPHKYLDVNHANHPPPVPYLASLPSPLKMNLLPTLNLDIVLDRTIPIIIDQYLQLNDLLQDHDHERDHQHGIDHPIKIVHIVKVVRI
jgi:hypothetical protein